VSIIGRLRHRLMLEAPQETPDGAGGVVRNWSALAQIWVAIEPHGGADGVVADKRLARLTHRVVMRKSRSTIVFASARAASRSEASATPRKTAASSNASWKRNAPENFESGCAPSSPRKSAAADLRDLG
jgi:head-tail adaptor